MKKLFSLILMFAIVLLPISALAAPGDAILLRQGEDGYDSSLRGMAEADGRLYILTYDALYTLESGASKPERHELELETQTEATQQAQQAAPQAENAADATSSILSDVVGGVLNNLGAEPQADETAAEAPEEAASVNREAVAIVVYGAQPCLIVSETTTQTYGSGMDMEYVSSVAGVWLSELAFVPIDLNPDAMRDEWSGDCGCGVKYFSQDGVIKLAPEAGIELDPAATPAEKLKAVQELMAQGDPRPRKIYETLGVNFGYAIAYYAMFYDIRHVLVMGRVTSGKGGELLLEKAREVLAKEFPELAEKIALRIPDEKSRRVGQSVAAASLAQRA